MLTPTQTIHALLAKHRMHVADCEALVLLAVAEQRDGMRVRDIRKRLQLHPNTVGAAIHRLHSRGEVERRGPRTGAAVWYSLTHDGARIVEKITQAPTP